MLNEIDSTNPLLWLSAILWPDESTVIGPSNEAPGTSAGDRKSQAEWWASPSVTQPNILIPAGSAQAARTAVRRYHDGFSTKRRARSLAAELITANERATKMALGNKRVTARVQPGVKQIGPGVLDGIRELLDLPELFVAVSLSTPKSNRKPVLQLLDGSGQCHGWAKVAWNTRTDALVGNEAFWLNRGELDGPTRLPEGLSPLIMPTLLHDVSIEGRRVVITSGVTPSRISRRSPVTPPAMDVFRAVNALGATDSIPIAESQWWHSVAAVIDHATDRERRAIEAAVDACRRLRFQVGAWHGDLTPWNLMTVKEQAQLIDWEFAADGAPLGFDLCHFHTQVGAEMKGLDAAGALDHSARLSPHGFVDLGVAAENRTATWHLYLVELMRRLLALRADGYPVDGVAQGPAALDRLEHALGLTRLRSTFAGSPEVGVR